MVADAAAINSNDAKTFLGDGESIFLINGTHADINDLRKLGNSASCIVIYNSSIQ